MGDFPRFTTRLSVHGWEVWDRMKPGVWTNGPSREWCQREAAKLNERFKEKERGGNQDAERSGGTDQDVRAEAE